MRIKYELQQNFQTKVIILIIAFGGIACPYESANAQHTPSATGFLGLNTVPSARMAESGTIRAGLSITDPYMHGFVGIQIARPLYVQMRQTVESASVFGETEALYPGLDVKLQVLEEQKYTPEIAIGLQSAIGHKRSSGEYISLSKRYKNFDFTAGLGWGRYGTAAHFSNPLKAISSHFEKDRNFESTSSNGPTNWFSGDTVGVFAGVEYFLPPEGLSLKIDYGADRYSAEQNAFNYDSPEPWNVGLSYNHNNWLSAGIAMQGTEKVLGRITFSQKPSDWPFKHKYFENPPVFQKRKNPTTNAKAIYTATDHEGITLLNLQEDENTIHATLSLSDESATPQQIGRTLSHIFEHSSDSIKQASITINNQGLESSTLRIMRRDVEKALDKNNSSSSEIWNNTDFIVTGAPPKIASEILPTKGIKPSYSLHLQNDLSLSDEHIGLLYRTSLIAKGQYSPFLNFLGHASLRANLFDNFDRLDDINEATLLPLRRDIAHFADEKISINSLASSYTHSFTPEWHAAATLGYLDEYYAGYGGEVLYRPFASRFAIGADIWHVRRRAPTSALNLALTQEQTVSGHLNLWYNTPYDDVTLKLRAGRFLYQDMGGTIGIEKIFENGAKLGGELALSTHYDTNAFGGRNQSYHKLYLSMPLGSIKYTPQGSEIRTEIKPLGRYAGQSLDKPIDLYSITNNMTLNHLSTHWDKLLD